MSARHIDEVRDDQIIDAHVYCLPDRLRDPLLTLDENNTKISQAIHRHPDAPWVLPMSSTEAILASMAAAAIKHSILVSFPWAAHELCVENNRTVLQNCRATSHFSAICSLQPLDPRWQQEAEYCKAAGASGLKVNADWQGFELDSHEMNNVAKWAGRNGMFILAHVDQAFRKSHASAAHILALAKNNSRTQILAAHLGGMLGAYAPLNGMAKSFHNLWFDTAVSSTLYMVRFYIDCGLTDKLIFGSDFPFNHCHDQASVANGIRSLGISTPDAQAIFSKNIRNLMRISAQGASS